MTKKASSSPELDEVRRLTAAVAHTDKFFSHANKVLDAKVKKVNYWQIKLAQAKTRVKEQARLVEKHRESLGKAKTRRDEAVAKLSPEAFEEFTGVRLMAEEKGL